MEEIGFMQYDTYNVMSSETLDLYVQEIYIDANEIWKMERILKIYRVSQEGR
jgi:hypothetical protein